MSETQPDDEYLWSRSGPIDAPVAALERELGSLAWQPRSLPSLAIASDEAPLRPVKMAARVERRRSEGRPALVAGLAMAAVVLSAIHLARPAPPSVRTPEPAMESVPNIQPAGPPQSNDLRDPFSSPPTRGSVGPSSRDLKDPFGNQGAASPAPPSQSELVDPFSSRRVRTPANASSPDLKDPFAKSNSSNTGSTSELLVDPFARNSKPSRGSEPSTTPSQPREAGSPDLVDPFNPR